MSAVVILPTTGAPEVRTAIESVLNQTYPTKLYLVCDGDQFKGKVKTIADEYLGNPNFKVCYLPDNVGANGFYGHRVYAAFSHLVNEEYVLFLDQDCWFDKDHVGSCVLKIKEKNLEWSYSLRKIMDKDGNYICNDDCESLGLWPAWTKVNHIDTNSYCVRRDVLIRMASIWHGGWGQDRVFLQAITTHFKRWDCTKKYTVNYRLAGNQGSVTKEFFDEGNKVMSEKYNGVLPWRND
jgi:glycosyltransferase involved in cell wall biosynthesis